MQRSGEEGIAAWMRGNNVFPHRSPSAPNISFPPFCSPGWHPAPAILRKHEVDAGKTEGAEIRGMKVPWVVASVSEYIEAVRKTQPDLARKLEKIPNAKLK